MNRSSHKEETPLITIIINNVFVFLATHYSYGTITLDVKLNGYDLSIYTLYACVAKEKLLLCYLLILRVSRIRKHIAHCSKGTDSVTH